MKKLLFLLLLTPFLSFSQSQTIYSVNDLDGLSSYYGYASRLYVISENSDYVLCTSCSVDGSTVLSGFGGRKWKKTPIVTGSGSAPFNFDSALATKTTDDVTEGSTNKYFHASDTTALHTEIVQLTNAQALKLNISDTSILNAEIAQLRSAVLLKLNISDTTGKWIGVGWLPTLAAKQDQLNGTGYLKQSGTTSSYNTSTQVTADLDVFTSSLKGLVPASGGSSRKVLHADGNWYDTTANDGGGGSSNVYAPLIKSGDTISQRYDVAHYGATGDGIYDTSGSMSSSSSQTTLTTTHSIFSSGDVGKYIIIVGAGTSGRDLVGTIVTYVSATQVLVSVSCATTVTNARLVFGTDQTPAIQAAINDCWMHGGGIVFIPKGIYMIAGALQTSVNGKNMNASIYVPSTSFSASDTGQQSVTIMGEGIPQLEQYSVYGGNDNNYHGTCLISAITTGATRAAIIGTLGLNNGFGTFNFTAIHIQNLIFKAPTVSSGGVVVGAVSIKNGSDCSIDYCVFSPMGAALTSVQPTNDLTGFEMPDNSSASFYSINNSAAGGVKNAFIRGEHVILNNVQAFVCPNAVLNKAGHHESLTYRIGAYWCVNDEVFSDSVTVNDILDDEHVTTATAIALGAPGAWFINQNTIKDSLNLGRGQIQYHLVRATIGKRNEDFLMTGGNRLITGAIDSAGGVFVKKFSNTITGDHNLFTGTYQDATGLFGIGVSTTPNEKLVVAGNAKIGGDTNAITGLQSGWNLLTKRTLELNSGTVTSTDANFTNFQQTINQSGTSNVLAVYTIGNTASTSSDKRMYQMYWSTDGAKESAIMHQYISNNGTLVDAFDINHLGAITFPQTTTIYPPDTTNYKPAVLDASGNLTKRYWGTLSAPQYWISAGTGVYSSNSSGSVTVGGATTAAFTGLQSGWNGLAKGGLELNTGSSSSFPLLQFTMSQSGTANSLGSIVFGNTASGASDKRMILIAGLTDGSTSSSRITTYISNAGALTEATDLDHLGRFGIGVASPTAFLHLKAGTATANTAPFKLTTGTSLTTPEAGAFEYTTPQLFFTNGNAVRQEIPQIQQSRVTTQFDKTSSTALADITGLTATTNAGTFRFEAILYTTSNVAGGVKFAISGTATASNIIYEDIVLDNNINAAQTRATGLNTAVGGVTAVTNAYSRITGTITISSGGTLTVQFAQNASNGSASSILVGSTFVVTQIN